VTQEQTESGGPVLIAFDGSEASRQAIVEVAGLRSGRRCVVLTVSTSANRGLEDFESDDALTEEHHLDADELDAARALSEEGVALAAAAGMQAEPSSLQVHGPAWTAIIDVAHTINAGLIVVGARTRHPIVEDILGSQALRVLQRADIPVLVVKASKHPTTVKS
jgi:nucleotide-binding universal stress UspA family protein